MPLLAVDSDLGDTQDLLGPTWTPYFLWREFVMGAVWLIILFTMKEIGKRNKCAHRCPLK